MSVCETCVANNCGCILSESEAIIHKDNFPNHDVVDIEKDKTCHC